jgi:hypothetical protein
MSGWLKAGLIGLGVLVVLNLIGLIPVVSICVVPLRWITYIVVGVLAASYMVPPRVAGQAAGQGALAAVVASAGGGLVNLVIGLIRAATGSPAQYADLMRQIPPEVIMQLREIGLTPEMIAGAGGGAAAMGSVALCGSVCCLGGIAFAAALAAIGAAVYASVKQD